MEKSTPEPDTQIPSKAFVRSVAVVVVALELIALVLAVVYMKTLGTTFAVVVVVAMTGSLLLSTKALTSGKPEWLLLDLFTIT